MVSGFQYHHYPTLPLPEIFVRLEWSRDPNRLALLPFAASSLFSATRKLGRGKPKAGGGVGVRTHYFSLLSYFWNTRWNLGKQTKYAYGLLKDWEIYTNLSLFFFLTVSKVMIIWFTYIPAISGELEPMQMWWLPYLEKKVTLARGSWTMRRTTLKLDSKASCFHFDRVPYYSI